MIDTTPTLTEQLQTLRANTARDLETWRGVLAECQCAGDSHGTTLATMAIWRVEMLLIDINELLRDAEAPNA